MQLFIAAFERVPDPRAENVRHDLGEMLIIAFVAVLCGAQGCAEMAEFGRAKLKFFKRFLKLKHGVPSHDTFSTVFRMIDPNALDAAFGQISARLVAALSKGGVIAIDGKSLKGAYDKGGKNSPAMMVSAYAAGLRLTLATVAARNRNEVDAGLEVLGLIDLKGKIVTGDALHCNRAMVEKIVEKGGDYCIALKGNQESLLSDARACLANVDKSKPGKKQPPTAKTETKAHGRIETRVGVVVEATGLAEHHEFKGLKAFGRVTATREIDGKITTDVRIFALSKKLSPSTLLETARAHWQIENALHWQLDVSFGEDAARNRKDNGPANIAVLRRRALDVARLDPSKGSLTAKLKRAGWNDDVMLEMLGRLSQMR
jgi:predicted transposase YbfD/YdcC